MDNKSPQSQQQPQQTTKKRVFISYAREDRARIKTLAARLEKDGVDVWWDIETPPGKRFVDVIAEALQTCDYVIVAWSKHSVESDWVKREAATGLDRNILLPILLEKLDDLPFLFSDLHACSLIDWHGESEHYEYQNLLTAIKASDQHTLTNKTPAIPPIIEQQAVSTPQPISPQEQDEASKNADIPSIPAKRSVMPFVIAGIIGLAGVGLASFYLSQPKQNLTPSTPTVTTNHSSQDSTATATTATTTATATDTSSVNDSQTQDQNNLDYGQSINSSQAEDTLAQESQQNPDSNQDTASPTGTGTGTGTGNTPIVPYKVTAKPSLVLRDQPQKQGKKIGNAPTNSTLYVTGKHSAAITIGDKTGHWVQITDLKSGKTAYAFDAYLEAYPSYKVLAKPSLTLRDKPSQKAKKIAALPTGLLVYPLATASGVQTIGTKSGKWVRIEMDGKTGYIFDAFLEKVD